MYGAPVLGYTMLDKTRARRFEHNRDVVWRTSNMPAEGCGRPGMIGAQQAGIQRARATSFCSSRQRHGASAPHVGCTATAATTRASGASVICVTVSADHACIATAESALLSGDWTAPPPTMQAMLCLGTAFASTVDRHAGVPSPTY